MRGWEREEAGNKGMSPGQEKGSLGAAGAGWAMFSGGSSTGIWVGQGSSGCDWVTGQCWGRRVLPGLFAGEEQSVIPWIRGT